ncbi:hypothetical protein GGF42_000977 [Coemansia sp. RSA 2424]|nr:hypothetical protein GGF42_000977 [Coemansia sp. RSA 2424]
MSNVVSPAQALPLEVLRQVVKYMTDNPKSRQDRPLPDEDYTKAMLTVCSSWRQAALEHMWGNVHLTMSSQTNKILFDELVWEIYRARTELSLDGTRLDGLAMFNRWKAAVVTRIAHDFYYAYSIIKAPRIFSKRWLSVSNRWFHFDPGEDMLSGKLLFRSDSQQVDGRLSHIIQPISQQATDDNTNVLDLSSISPDWAH